MSCWWLFFHSWDKWQDTAWTYTRLLTMADGVPHDKWGTIYTYHKQGQIRECRLCGRKQTRKVR